MPVYEDSKGIVNQKTVSAEAVGIDRFNNKSTIKRESSQTEVYNVISASSFFGAGRRSR